MSGAINNAAVLVCSGSYDTNIKKTGEDYRSITWDDILAMVTAPACVEKEQAPAMIPSTYVGHDGRAHEVQRQRGSFVFLAGDVDKGTPDRAKLLSALQEVTAQPCDMVVYSTASARPEQKKWRFLLRLSEPVPGAEYPDVQEALFSLLEERGIQLDWSLARVGQLVYLPNVPTERRQGERQDGEPVFYDYTMAHGGLLKLSETAIPARMEQYRKEKAAQEAEAARLRAEAQARRQDRAARRGNSEEGSLIDAYNADNPVEECLARYGYKPDGKGNWRSPYQEGGTFATRIFDGTWFSLSGSDAAQGLGSPSKDGSGVFGDAYDLFAHFDHKGDDKAAFRELGKRYGFQSTGPSVSEMIDDMIRRDRQRQENVGIGAEAPVETMPTYLGLDEALERFVFATDGSRAIDLLCPSRDLALPDFRNAFAASKITVKTESRDGKEAEREVPTVSLWMQDRKRHTVHGRTFRPGAGIFTTDPRGFSAVNSWRAVERGEPSASFETHASAFAGHVEFLFGADASRFLDWLAHIEQQPGVLPHTAWLHVSTATGTGRNALASILTRIWRGQVAASFDLARCLSSGFNGELSGRVLAIVDEIREGGRGEEWSHSESLKRLITEEQRLINPKYGRQSVEFNACRFLLLSNHVSAIPLDRTDRRFEVVIFEGAPKPEGYYSRLYALVKNPVFISDVALWLRQRDVSRFNPGKHAKATAAKGRVVEVSLSEGALYAKAVADHWPTGVILNGVLSAIVDPHAEGAMTASIRRACSEVGMRPSERPVWAGGKPQRVYIVRDLERWLNASSQELAAEAERGAPNRVDPTPDWRQHINMLAARAGGRQ
jgi:hypothetical protein